MPHPLEGQGPRVRVTSLRTIEEMSRMLPLVRDRVGAVHGDRRRHRIGIGNVTHHSIAASDLTQFDGFPQSTVACRPSASRRTCGCSSTRPCCNGPRCGRRQVRGATCPASSRTSWWRPAAERSPTRNGTELPLAPERGVDDGVERLPSAGLASFGHVPASGAPSSSAKFRSATDRSVMAIRPLTNFAD